MVKSEAKSIVHPCLSFGGGGDRHFGIIPKKEQPPVTKMDLYTGAIMTDKGNTTPPRKSAKNPTPPTITYPNPTQGPKSGQNRARGLKTVQGATHQPQEEQQWGANDWNRSNWMEHYVGRGPQSVGGQTHQRHKQKAITQKGERRHKHGQT